MSDIERKFFLAVMNGKLDEVRTHLANGADLNWRCPFRDHCPNSSPLVCAVCFKRVEVVKMLLDAGANVTRSEDETWPPLQQAVLYSSIEIIQILIDAGADLNERCNLSGCDFFRSTPLHYAAFYKMEHAAIILIKNGADVNARNEAGKTPLHYAASHGQTEIVRRLLEAGADPDVKDKNNYTPLLLASTGRGYQDIISLLKKRSR